MDRFFYFGEMSAIKSCFLFLLAATTIILFGCEEEEIDPVIPEEYFTFSLDGQNGGPLTDSIGAARTVDTTILFGYQFSGDVFVNAKIVGGAVADSFYMKSMTIRMRNKEYKGADSAIKTIIISYGNPGENITGSYAGNLKDSLGMVFPVNGIFRVKRNN